MPVMVLVTRALPPARAGSRRRLLAAGIALAAAAALPLACKPEVPPPPPMPQGATWAGGWDTTFGVLALEQRADEILGVYKYPNGGAVTTGVLKGKLVGGRLDFEWREQEGGSAHGRGHFDMQASGDAFTGRFGYGDSAEDGVPWVGTRLK